MRKHPAALVKAASELVAHIDLTHPCPAASDALQQATASIASLLHSEQYTGADTLSLLEAASKSSTRAVVLLAKQEAVTASLQAVTAMLSRMGHGVYRDFVRRSFDNLNR